MGDKFSFGFLKTKKSLAEKFTEIFKGSIDDELYEELIEILILSDVPFATAEKIINTAKKTLNKHTISDEELVKDAVRQSALEVMKKSGKQDRLEFPCIVLVSGVNGVGKTTTIAKLANILKSQGKTVLLAAADTFRAAASEQLTIWASRLDIPIIKSLEGQDASSVVFDALSSAKSKKIDVVLCDTAGRLQNKVNLMNELEKIYRVAEKNRDAYNLYSLLVLDSMSGQNSISQLKSFSEIKAPDGLILTKTDSSAKGGVLLGIADQSEVPVWYIGTGETVDDIAEFDAEKYVDAII